MMSAWWRKEGWQAHKSSANFDLDQPKLLVGGFFCVSRYQIILSQSFSTKGSRNPSRFLPLAEGRGVQVWEKTVDSLSVTGDHPESGKHFGNSGEVKHPTAGHPFHSPSCLFSMGP